MATSRRASLVGRIACQAQRRPIHISCWWEQIQVSPVQHRDLILNVVLFAFQGFFGDALDGHQPLGSLLFC